MLAEADRLAAVGRALSALPDAAGLTPLTTLACELLQVEFGFLSLVQADGEQLVAQAGSRGGSVPPELPLDESVCRHLVESGQQLLVPDLWLHPALRDLVEVRELGLRSYAGSPVHSDEGHVLGGLCVGSVQPRQWTTAEALLLTGLAGAASRQLRLQVALADLEVARQRERRRAEEQAALRRVASSVARGEPPEVVLQQIVEELTGLLDVAGALVLRFEPDGRAQVAASAGTDGTPALDAVGGCANALAQVRALRPSALGCDGDAPCAVVPVVLGTRLWGAVVALTDERGQERALRQLEPLADFIRLLVVNAQAQQELRELARTDPLTGAANRRAFDERLADELERAARHVNPLVLALLDVDRFKQVNDERGHETGDRVLLELTGRVGEHLRATDLLARLGGDEWALLLPETSREAGEAVVQRVGQHVRLLPLAGVAVTVSIGAAVAPDGYCTAAQLYRAADAALYAAKSAGRDTVVVRDLEVV